MARFSPYLTLSALVFCRSASLPAQEASNRADREAAQAQQTKIDAALAKVARIHGDAGPWAVAGYRMGEYALRRLALPPQSFDLEVVHRAPRTVQYSCIADGAAAATGASIGKLNLVLIEAPLPDLQTTYRRKSNGLAISLKPSRSFVAKFSNLPRDEIRQAGRTVMTLPDDQVFEELSKSIVTSPRPTP